MNTLVRLSLPALLLGFFLSSCQQAPGPMSAAQKEAVKNEVRPAVTDLVDALQKRDLKRALSHFSTSENAAFVIEGKIYTVASLRDLGKERWADVAENSYEFQEPKVSVLAPDAIVGSVEGVHIAKDTLGETFGGPIAWTMVWVKEGEDWKMLQGHFSEPLVLTFGEW